jgi:hypothetical protein
MRRALIALALTLGVLLTALVVTPLLLRDRLLKLVVDQANQQLNATVEIGDASASFFGDFPRLSLTLSDVAVKNHAPFEGTTLLAAKELGLSVDVLALVQRGEVNLRGLSLRGAALTVLTDAEGNTNTDIMKPSEATPAAEAEASAFRVKLQGYELEDVNIRYDDAGFVVTVLNLDHSGVGDFTQDLVALSTETSIASLTVKDGGVNLLDSARLTSSLAMTYDQRSGGVTLAENELTLNALRLALTGRATPVEGGWDLDLGLGALETSFKGLLSLVPSVYSSSFEGLGTTGTLALNGTVKGLYPDEGDDLPAIDLKLNVKDGSFRDPSLPSGVTNIDLDGTITHPGGDLDRMVIDLSRFGMTVEGAPLAGRVRVSRLNSDPVIDLEAKGDVDLTKLRAALPPSEESYTGQLKLDVRLAGAVSAFESPDMAGVKAEGDLHLTDFKYSDPSVPVPISIATMRVALTPSAANLSELQMALGDSDVAATGRIDNVVAWALTDAPLTGNLSLQSRRLDLDPWSSDDAEGGAPSGEAPESSIFVVPEGYNFSVSATIKQLVYDGETYENVKGTMIMADGQMRFEELQVSLLGGALALNGSYSASSAESADVDLTLTLGNPELAAALKESETFRALAVLIEQAKGTFRADLRVKSRLGPDLSPDLSTLWSEGRFTTYGVTFEPKFMKEVAKALGRPELAKVSLTDKDVQFRVDQGRVKISPVKVSLGGTEATLAGSSGAADGSLDYTLRLKLPTTQLTNTALASRLGGAAGDADVLVKIGGTAADPKVSLSLDGAGEALVDDLKSAATAQLDVAKDAVMEQVDAAVDQALAAAKLQGDKLVAEAAIAADKLRAEGKIAGDKLRAEAKNKAKKLRQEAKGADPISKAAADKAADKLVSETEQKATQLEREANKKAKQLEDGAAAKSDSLLSAAQAKAGR